MGSISVVPTRSITFRAFFATVKKTAALFGLRIHVQRLLVNSK
jgi:hypothetical protein